MSHTKAAAYHPAAPAPFPSAVLSKGSHDVHRQILPHPAGSHNMPAFPHTVCLLQKQSHSCFPDNTYIQAPLVLPKPDPFACLLLHPRKDLKSQASLAFSYPGPQFLHLPAQGILPQVSMVLS